MRHWKLTWSQYIGMELLIFNTLLLLLVIKNALTENVWLLTLLHSRQQCHVVVQPQQTPQVRSSHQRSWHGQQAERLHFLCLLELNPMTILTSTTPCSGLGSRPSALSHARCPAGTPQQTPAGPALPALLALTAGRASSLPLLLWTHWEVTKRL